MKLLSGMDEVNAIGEVVESSTRQFVAEVYDEVDAPAFGHWVRVEGEGEITLFGLVSHVETGSYDSNREAVALGLSPEERAEEMPMVQELMRTTVRALVLACRDRDGRLRQTRPPPPPPSTTSFIPAPTNTSAPSTPRSTSYEPSWSILILPSRSTICWWPCSSAFTRHMGESMAGARPS